ncbi:isocitrate lyase/PEP mutase family protein [Brevibacterium album]|uniref:isocitrate lyase/PEP mutase family protein n=1 Tax=Brevibacterium album TaxID=417948 RepID=UPI0004045CC0|nr:isocitrate lyase/phosphoenolpyruvate mutase family protein [Brevibacterium album]
MERTEFLDLHVPGSPLILPNAWDAGAARMLESLGFSAVATTSSGFAATLARRDGGLSRDEALENCAAIVAATSLPVNADLENGYSDDPAGVAETVALAAETGVAAVSVEDCSAASGGRVYELSHAAERIAAAAEAARGAAQLVIVGRAENFLQGVPDLADTIARLQAYQEAGADVLYAPGLTSAADIRAVVSSVDRPVNVLATGACPSVEVLAELGAARVSVGGALAFTAYAAAAEAARELLGSGTYGYLPQAAAGRAIAEAAFD